MKKICRGAKNRQSRRRQRQSGYAEKRAAGLTARRCDVGPNIDVVRSRLARRQWLARSA